MNLERPNTLQVVVGLDGEFSNAGWGRRVDYVIDHVKSQHILSHVVIPNMLFPLSGQSMQEQCNKLCSALTRAVDL